MMAFLRPFRLLQLVRLAPRHSEAARRIEPMSEVDQALLDQLRADRAARATYAERAWSGEPVHQCAAREEDARLTRARGKAMAAAARRTARVT